MKTVLFVKSQTIL